MVRIRKVLIAGEAATAALHPSTTIYCVIHTVRAIRVMKYWLMKAEPQSRLVKGKDVKVSGSDCR